MAVLLFVLCAGPSVAGVYPKKIIRIRGLAKLFFRINCILSTIYNCQLKSPSPAVFATGTIRRIAVH
jgi:hypothetical protein